MTLPEHRNWKACSNVFFCSMYMLYHLVQDHFGTFEHHSDQIAMFTLLTCNRNTIYLENSQCCYHVYFDSYKANLFVNALVIDENPKTMPKT